MIKSTKSWIIVSVALILAGLAVFAGAMTILHWDFGKLSSTSYVTNTYDITESFDDLSVRVDTDNIAFVPSEDKTCRVVCYEQEKMKHTVGVSNKTLEIGVHDDRSWTDSISFFSFDSPKITVYLPKESYGALVIETETGDIDIPESFSFNSVDISGSTGEVKYSASCKGAVKLNLSTGKIELDGMSANSLELTTTTGDIDAESISVKEDIAINVSTGKTSLTDASCKNLVSDGSTGDIDLKNTVASGSFTIRRSTGDVAFNNSDADELMVKTGTGDVTGSLLSEKIFFTNTATGDVDVPKTTSGGKCEITTETGDIRIEIRK